MDKNKLEELKCTGYFISPCCGLCRHARFTTPGVLFGTCAVHEYTHLKHTGTDRFLSISRYGCCADGSFRVNHLGLVQIAHYKELLDPILRSELDS